MSDAAIDTNSRQTMTARLLTDGVTITRLTALPASGTLSTTTTTAGAVAPKTFAATDSNGRGTLYAVSQNDPTVLVALQCNSNGELLVKNV